MGVRLISKIQSFSEVEAPLEYEGAITSRSNIRPDEIILKVFNSKASLNIFLNNGKPVELPLYLDEDQEKGTLTIPEKFFKEAVEDHELKNLLEGVFDNQRRLDLEINGGKNEITLRPIGVKKNLFTLSFIR